MKTANDLLYHIKSKHLITPSHRKEARFLLFKRGVGCVTAWCMDRIAKCDIEERHLSPVPFPSKEVEDEMKLIIRTRIEAFYTLDSMARYCLGILASWQWNVDSSHNCNIHILLVEYCKYIVLPLQSSY